MWDYIGMAREAEGLKKAIKLIAELKEEFYKDLRVTGEFTAMNNELEKAGRVADFIDIFIIGEGEEVNIELTDLYMQAKKEGWDKQRFLQQAAQIGGVYVPSLYDVSYREDGTIDSVKPNCPQAPEKVTKRIIADLDKVYYPKQFVVPFINIVHDRSMLEIQRGCLRGCRFCQAGFIYRPLRDKHYDTLNADAHSLCDTSGYEELSLTSLSTSDYKEIEPLLDDLLNWTTDQKVSLSLPSLRVDNFSKELMDKVSRLKKSGLTFAAEAGTQRLRDVINKNVTEEEVLTTCRTAFEGGYTSVKLYFMMGLPTETMEDIEGIANLAQKVVDLYYSIPTRPKGRSVSVSISCACFVPKPFTPFQFEGQDSMELLREKQKHLLASVKSKKISVSYHDADVSFIEAILAKGDRRLGDVIEQVWKKGSRLDGWYEYFDPQRWYDAMEELGIDPAFYANRRRSYDEVMPWDHLDYCVSKEFLIRENKQALESTTTPQCREKCSACGANKLMGGGRCCANIEQVNYERPVQPIQPPQPQPQELPPQPPPQQQHRMMMIRMIHRQPPPPQPLLPQHMLCFTSLASSGSYYVDRVGVVPADRILFSICGNGRLISPAPCSFS